MDIEELTFKNKIELAKFLQQENKQLKENYERIYNENCKLREEHNITDISLLDENQELNQKYENAVADYETTMSELQELKKENKILRKNAENNDKVVDKVNWENMLLKKENQELKKQLEEYQLQNIDLRTDIMIQKTAFPHKLIKDKTFYELYDMPNYEDLLNQQKEFINKIKELETKLKGNGINE